MIGKVLFIFGFCESVMVSVTRPFLNLPPYAATETYGAAACVMLAGIGINVLWREK